MASTSASDAVFQLKSTPIGDTTNDGLFSIRASGSAGVDKLFIANGTGNKLVTIASSGNVGIGTSNPSSGILQITMSAGAPNNTNFLNLNRAGTAKVNIITNGGDGGEINLIDNSSNSGLLNSGRLFLNSGGPNAIIDSTNDAGFDFRSDIGLTTLMTINGLGNVGIGTTTPAQRLHIASASSDDFVLRVQDSDGTCDFNPESTDQPWTCSSDARLKTNIREAAPTLPYLLGVPIKDFTVISSNEEKTGVVAQELLANYSELVNLGDDGYYKVTPIGSWKIIKGIQELNAKVASLSAQVNDSGTVSGSGGTTINDQLSASDILGVYASGSAVVIEHASGFDSLSLKAVKEVIFDVPVAIFQNIKAKGDVIAEGIKKTYYSAVELFPNYDLSLLATNWLSRNIEISSDADSETRSLFSGSGAQAADNSKVNLEDNGAYLATYGVDSTRGEIQLSGTSDLVYGEAKVYFDYSFTELIASSSPIKVIITPTTRINGQLYVDQKTPYGFVVKELNGVDASAKFDWLVIARRRGYEEPIISESPTPEPSLEAITSPAPEPSPTPIPNSEPTISPTPLEPAAASGSLPLTGQAPEATPAPEPTASPTPEPSIEPSPTPTPTSEPTPSDTVSRTPTPTPTPTESPTPTPSPSATPTPAPEPTPEPTS